MKKTSEIKYPSAAHLFQFCRRVLDHKFGGARVIDQDVGQILGFDPADCSHWKKGKKNIRSIQAMRAIADHLGVDERLVVEIAGGDLSEGEAFEEYCGYGAFQINPKIIESARKDFYRKNAANWTRDKEQEFREFFTAQEASIEQLVKDIHARINFQEAPLYLPEITSAYPELRLEACETPLGEVTAEQGPKAGGTGLKITYAVGSEMRPFVRYRIAKLMAGYFLPKIGLDPTAKGDIAFGQGSEFTQHLADVQSNVFAAHLLTPAPLLRREMAQVNVMKDIVTQLAEVFWVSKSFMNRRLKEILQTL